MQSEYLRLIHIKNNLAYTRDDIMIMLINENDCIDRSMLKAQAQEIFRIIHSDYRHETYLNTKEDKKTDYKDVELIGMIDNQRLIEIEEDLKRVLSDDQYQVYQMLKQQCNYQFIMGWINISQRTYYKMRQEVYNKIMNLLMRR